MGVCAGAAGAGVVVDGVAACDAGTGVFDRGASGTVVIALSGFSR